MTTLQTVPVASLITHRDKFTRPCGFAGVSVAQAWPLVPLLQRILAGKPEEKPKDTFYQAAIDQARTNGGGGHTYDELRALALDIKQNGIKYPITGWRIDKKIELLGGHHRACIAHVLGIPNIVIELYPLDLVTGFNCVQDTVRAAYDDVRAQEKGLPAGMSYLPVDGLRSIRNGWDRFAMMYEELITVRGSSVLDAGCNDGFFGINLLLHDFNVRFVDYSAPLMKVVEARYDALQTARLLSAWRGKARFNNQSIQDFLKSNVSRFDVILFMDVMQHIAHHSGAAEALDTLSGLLKIMNERMIFSPGRKDMLDKAGITERELLARMKGYRMRYLGKDTDGGGYGREIYVVYR